MAGWTCTFCWYRNKNPMRFACKHCGQPKHGG